MEQVAVATDSYLSGVLQSVMDSDDNLFRDFFLDVRETVLPTGGGRSSLKCGHHDHTGLNMSSLSWPT